MQELGEGRGNLLAITSWTGGCFFGVQPPKLAPALCFGHYNPHCLEYREV